MQDELDDERRSAETSLARIHDGYEEALARQRADDRADAAKEAAKAALVTGGAATVGALGTSMILDRVDDDKRPVAQAIAAASGAALLLAAAAGEPGSNGRRAAAAGGIAMLAAVVVDVFRKPRAEGATGGIGVEVNLVEDALDILRVEANSPAARAGLRVGDKIMSINDKAVALSGADKAADRLVGPIGEAVTLKVRRINPWKLLQVKLIREAL